MTFPESLEQAAEEYRNADFKDNPNGYTVAPYVNEWVTFEAFQAGARWALQNEVVAKMAEALEEIRIKLLPKIPKMDGTESWSPQQKFIDQVSGPALTAYQQAVKEEG